MSIDDDPKPRRPSSSTGVDHIEKVLSVIRENRRLTIRVVSEELDRGKIHATRF